MLWWKWDVIIRSDSEWQLTAAFELRPKWEWEEDWGRSAGLACRVLGAGVEVVWSGEAAGWGAEVKGEYQAVVDEAGEAGGFQMDHSDGPGPWQARSEVWLLLRGRQEGKWADTCFKGKQRGGVQLLQWFSGSAMVGRTKLISMQVKFSDFQYKFQSQLPLLRGIEGDAQPWSLSIQTVVSEVPSKQVGRTNFAA